MRFAAPSQRPRRVISPICCRPSATPGKTHALSPDQLHDHDKQPEIAGGFRASQLIETGGAKVHAERPEADDHSRLLRRALNEREKITERKQERREDEQGSHDSPRRFPPILIFFPPPLHFAVRSSGG